MTQIFDIGWLLDPGCQRLLDNFAASPGAFKTVRVMKIFTNGGTLETGVSGTTTSSGTVWPAGGSIDFTDTFNALYQLTSRQLIPFIVLGFFPDGIYNGTTGGIAGPTGPISATTNDWNIISANWTTLVQTFLDQLLNDGRFGLAIEQWWFEVWNEPDNSSFWNPDSQTVPPLSTLPATPPDNALNYYQQLYQTTSEAVKGKYNIRLGGPTIVGQNVTGLAVTTPPTVPTLMSEFVDFLKTKGAKCDFISFHGKGQWDGCLNSSPNLQTVIDCADQTAQLRPRGRSNVD